MRHVCPRCRRPASVCYCEFLTPVPTKTRLVFLQHPRERKVAIGTARMAHLALPNSEFHVGVSFDDHSRVQELKANADGNVALLFPSEDAIDPRSLRDAPPKTLIVIDGTWTQAAKVLKSNPTLLSLPKIALKPEKPGNYRIRKEPAEHCLSTIEAVVEILGQLEGQPERFGSMLRGFERMVDMQLEAHAGRVGPPRKRLPRNRPKVSWWPPQLTNDRHRVVLAYAEANAPSLVSDIHFDPELVHLVAVRPHTGERFEAIVRPEAPLGDGTCKYVELTPEQLAAGETRQSFLQRWRAFAGEDAILAVWGGFTRSLLERAGDVSRPFLDLRLAAARKLNVKIGGMGSAAERMTGSAGTPWAQARAGRRLAALEQVAQGLLDPQVARMKTREVTADPRG